MSVPLRFPGEFPWVIGDRAAPEPAQLACYPASGEVRKNSQRLVVPASDRQQANELLANFDEAIQESYEVLGPGSKSLFAIQVSKHIAQSLFEVRMSYDSTLKEWTKNWVALGRPYTKEIAEDLFDGRQKLRSAVRQKLPMPWAYDLIDDVRDSMRQEAIQSGKKAGTAYSELVRQNYKKTIDGALKSNPNWTAAAKISKDAAQCLSRISHLVTVVEIGSATASVYLARTPEQERAALERLYKSVGETTGAAAGSAIGGYLCSAIGVSTAGWGFVTCGVIPAAASAFGAFVGRNAGDKVFQFLATPEAGITERIQYGPVTPAK